MMDRQTKHPTFLPRQHVKTEPHQTWHGIIIIIIIIITIIKNVLI